MSLVNALINQIGREIGRDVYHTAKRSLLNDFSTKRGRVTANLPMNQQLLLKIEEVQRAKSGLDLTQLTNLVHDICGHVDTKTADWDDVFIRIDRLIDERKINAEQNELNAINEIDQLNLSNYRFALKEHQNWVRDRIEVLNKEDLMNWKEPSQMKLFAFSIFGVGSAFLNRGVTNSIAEFLVPWICGLMFYAGFILNAGGDKSLNLLALGGIVIYSLTILGNFLKRSDLVKNRSNLLAHQDHLKAYYQEIIQIHF